MLLCLQANEPLYVQEVAQHLNLTEDVASKNLQLLAPGGFAVSESVSKYLYYRLAEPDALLQSVLVALQSRKSVDVEQVMSILTALTHERRVVIISILKNNGPVSTAQLLFRAQISKIAGYRHLDKLVRRGWVEMNRRACQLSVSDEPLKNALINEVKSITLAQV
jgi:predicted transcriptional regulator